MRRRLTLTIVAVVAGALLVAGLGSLLFARRSARIDTRDQLLREATAFAQAVDANDAAGTAAQAAVRLTALQRALRLEQAEVIGVGARCGERSAALGVPLSAAECRQLAGEALAGVRGNLAWAAAPVSGLRGRQGAILLTRRVPGVAKGAGYLLITGAITLLVAAAAAEWLSGRIARPLKDAEAATRRIATGDLAAKVPVGADTDPELASLAHSINSMADSLARSKGLERQFLLSVSHELRTPLTSIRGYAEAIGDGTAADPARASEVIGAEARRLERLVGDLLDLAKLDARRFSLDLRRVDAAGVVEAVADSFIPAASDAGLSIRVDTPGEGAGLPVTADPDRLAQVVANLVENAFKFAAAAITVSARPDPPSGGVILTVADDGPGIPPADLPRVFERLYQSTRTPARQAGSGLGLAIVAELVAAMGGRVRAVSPTEDSRGTRLEVWLPGAEEPSR